MGGIIDRGPVLFPFTYIICQVEMFAGIVVVIIIDVDTGDVVVCTIGYGIVGRIECLGEQGKRSGVVVTQHGNGTRVVQRILVGLALLVAHLVMVSADNHGKTCQRLVGLALLEVSHTLLVDLLNRSIGIPFIIPFRSFCLRRRSCACHAHDQQKEYGNIPENAYFVCQFLNSHIEIESNSCKFQIILLS